RTLTCKFACDVAERAARTADAASGSRCTAGRCCTCTCAGGEAIVLVVAGRCNAAGILPGTTHGHVEGTLCSPEGEADTHAAADGAGADHPPQSGCRPHMVSAPAIEGTIHCGPQDHGGERARRCADRREDAFVARIGGEAGGNFWTLAARRRLITTSNV